MRLPFPVYICSNVVPIAFDLCVRILWLMRRVGAALYSRAAARGVCQQLGFPAHPSRAAAAERAVCAALQALQRIPSEYVAAALLPMLCPRYAVLRCAADHPDRLPQRPLCAGPQHRAHRWVWPPALCLLPPFCLLYLGIWGEGMAGAVRHMAVAVQLPAPCSILVAGGWEGS